MEVIYWEPDTAGEKLVDADLVAEYLASAHPLLAAPMADVDVLDPGGKVIGSVAWVTDGEFVFSASWSYYVRTYCLAPPEVVLARIRERNYVCPTVTTEQAREASGLLGFRAGPPTGSSEFSPF